MKCQFVPRFIIASVAFFAVECALHARVLFYPNLLTAEKNLFDECQWTPPNQSFEKGSISKRLKGGPFSPDDTVYFVKTVRSHSAYWRARPSVEKGRKYLVGAWVRFPNAKVLLGNDAIHPVSGRRLDRRLYCFGGHNAWIEPFLSPRTREVLGGDSATWRLCYRLVEFPEGIKPGSHRSAFGLYLAAGEMEFSKPFFVDVTDVKDHSLLIDIAGEKPIKRIAVIHVGLRDVIWEKNFPSPVTDFRQRLEGITDCMRGLDRNTIEGHALDVYYVDGSKKTVFAPQERIFQEF